MEEEIVPPLAANAKLPSMLTLYRRDLSYLPDGLLKECLFVSVKVACKHCADYPALWDYVMDFVQEGNKEVLEGMQYQGEWDAEHIKSYVARSAKGTIYQYLARTFDIYIPPTMRHRTLQRKNEQELEHLDILEHHVSWESLLEHKVQIPDSTNMQHAFDRAKRKQVEHLLAYLPVKEREVVALYYGLDGAAQGSTEIASTYGLSRDHIKILVNTAIKRLSGEQVQPSREWIDLDRPRRLQAVYDAHQGKIKVRDLATLARVHHRKVKEWLKEQGLSLLVKR